MILPAPSRGLGGFAEMSDVQTYKAKPFKHTLMSSEAKESQVGFDLRAEAHPSDTHGINTKGGRCFSWEKTGRRRQWLNPRLGFTENQTPKKKKKRKNFKLDCRETGQNSFCPRGVESSFPRLTRKAIRLRCVLSH